MEVVRFTEMQSLAEHAGAWNRLAGDVPFRTWQWLATWWRHYGSPGGLNVLAVFDRGELVGLAPWYRTRCPSRGRTLRLMGDGEICSEYVTVLSLPGMEQPVGEALACRLAESSAEDAWDLLELSAVNPDDFCVKTLARRLAAAGCRLHTRAGPNCWRIPLPATWEDYLRALSRNRRKALRQMERKFIDSGRAVLHRATGAGELGEACRILADLHERRRAMLGQTGCFSSRRYAAFHAEAMEWMLRQSRLGLYWLELDGEPAAAEYHLLGREVVYCYQGGMAPGRARVSPGQIATLMVLKDAIERGYRVFDFLRGDEPYKRQWRARPHGTVEIRVAAARPTARVRHGLWLAALELKQWLQGAAAATDACSTSPRPADCD